MKNEEKLSNLLTKKPKKSRPLDKKLDSSINIFPLKQNPIPELQEQKESKQKAEKKPDLSVEFSDLKNITKKYLDRIYSLKENQVQNNTYNNNNLRIFHENPDYYSSNLQRINNINKNESIISSKNMNVSSDLIKNESANNIIIDKKNIDASNMSNKTDFVKNNILQNSESLLFNSNYSVRTPTIVNKPVSSYDNFIQNTVNNKLNTTFQSNKQPKRFEQSGVNVIKFPFLPNPIPTFAEGGVMDVKGPQLIEVGSDKNNAPMMERIMAFSKPAQSLMSAINPFNVGKNISNLMKSSFGEEENITESPKSSALGGFIQRLKDSYSEESKKKSDQTSSTSPIVSSVSANNSNNSTTNIVSSVINTESTLQTVLTALDYGLRSRHKIG